jgi:hypothetical protein
MKFSKNLWLVLAWKRVRKNIKLWKKHTFFCFPNRFWMHFDPFRSPLYFSSNDIMQNKAKKRRIRWQNLYRCAFYFIFVFNSRVFCRFFYLLCAFLRSEYPSNSSAARISFIRRLPARLEIFKYHKKTPALLCKDEAPE